MLFDTMLLAPLVAALQLCSSASATSLLSRPPGIQQFLSTWKNSPLASYPSDFTRGIIPKGIHSHNDYWRDVPLYSALAVGAISVEADVWLFDDDDELYVGHDTSSLTPNRTLDSLYIQPLVSILKAQNPSSRFVGKAPTHNGVFDTEATQTLYLWIDVKTSGITTWPHVVRALEPLRSRGYLTTVSPSTGIIYGAITVIGTGSTPLSQIAPIKSRDYFYDGPLQDLAANNITREISPIASAELAAVVGTGAPLNEIQMETVRGLAKNASALGIETRFWGLPGWPVKTRNTVWSQLVDQVFLLNVDDLQAAAEGDW